MAKVKYTCKDSSKRNELRWNELTYDWKRKLTSDGHKKDRIGVNMCELAFRGDTNGLSKCLTHWI
jgi:hypothetical protein